MLGLFSQLISHQGYQGFLAAPACERFAYDRQHNIRLSIGKYFLYCKNELICTQSVVPTDAFSKRPTWTVSQREMLMRCGQQDGKRRNTGHRYRTARQKLLLRSWTGNAVLEQNTGNQIVCRIFSLSIWSIGVYILFGDFIRREEFPARFQLVGLLRMKSLKFGHRFQLLGAVSQKAFNFRETVPGNLVLAIQRNCLLQMRQR